MQSMTSFEFGGIILVPFPFTDQSATKKRPAVVISSEIYNTERPDLIIMAVTSQIQPARIIGEVIIKDWQEAGLLKPSVMATESTEEHEKFKISFATEAHGNTRKRR